VAAVSGTQGERTEARQRGAGVESEQAGQIAAAGAEAGSQEIFGAEGERFGPTLAAEHLAEEDAIRLDHETLRRWLLAEGLWSRRRKRKQHCQRRERKPHFGELVQLDGSFHDWLEETGPRGCLMNMVDDATSTTQARLGTEETIWAAVGMLRAWINQYGVPRALYPDWKNVHRRKATPGEQLRGRWR